VFHDIGFTGDAASAGAMCVRHLGTRPIFPETVEALKALKAKVKIGVFSNADDASLRPLLAGTGVAFDAIESSESARVYKPAREAFDRIVSLLGGHTNETWYVGDHLYDDVVGAHGAGVTSVWINRNAEAADGDVLPDIEITSLLDLPKLIDELQPS
jgi:2-haloalkanoic acid dehalogenase type II